MLCGEEFGHGIVRLGIVAKELAMSRSFERNRRLLARLVHQLERFSEEELLQKFREANNGDIAIGVFETVRDFLEDQLAFEVLVKRNGQYVLRSVEESTRCLASL